ncbi:MAG: tetratricopeptide repeat protein [Thermoanaerobaculia bacterium]
MELLFASEGPLATLAVVERRLATYRSVLGESDVRTALALSDLAVVEHQLGRNEAAEVGYRTSAAILAEVAADNDPRAAYPHANLAALLRESGRVEEAEREARLAYSIRRTALGPAHPETALTLSFLGRVLIERGNLEEGEAAVREALGHLEGRDTFGASTARENLAAMLLASGRPAEALQQAERVVAERAEMLPEEHILSLSARLLRAKVLAEIGRLEEARSELAAVLPALERQGDAAGSLAEAARQLVAKLGESAPAGERK